MSCRQRTCGACVAALAGALLMFAQPVSASADGCPNAQFRVGPSERLPDCRAFEQVSPVEKDGLDAVTIQPLQPAQSAACEGGEPCTLAYMNVGAAFDGAPGNEFANAYLATRGADGLADDAAFAADAAGTREQPRQGRLRLLGRSVAGDPARAAPAADRSRPRRASTTCSCAARAAATRCDAEQPVRTAAAGCGRCFEHEDVPAFAGASSDFSHVIFEANDSLVAGAPGKGVENLYETVAGARAARGILPDGTIPAQGATAGGGIDAVDGAHAASSSTRSREDGSHVAVRGRRPTAAPRTPSRQARPSSTTASTATSTVEVSAPAPGAGPEKCETRRRDLRRGAGAVLGGVGRTARLVYFTSKAALTKESYTGAKCDAGTKKRAREGDPNGPRTGSLPLRRRTPAR